MYTCRVSLLVPYRQLRWFFSDYLAWGHIRRNV